MPPRKRKPFIPPVPRQVIDGKIVDATRMPMRGPEPESPILSEPALVFARVALDKAWKHPITRDDLVRVVVSAYVGAVERSQK